VALQLSIENNYIIMDTKLIKQYGEDILSYRLRTARNKKRMQYEDFYKRLINLHKEERALIKQYRNLGWEPLVPPVQKGWKRVFVLRDDVARSKHAEFYAGILAKINTTQWSHRRDFLKKKRAFGRKKYVERQQFLLKPCEYHFRKLELTEKERQQFHEVWSYERARGPFIKRYVFTEPWRFVLRVQPNIIDKVRKTDPELEARLHEIESYLERNALENVVTRLLGNTESWYKKQHPKPKEVYYLKNKPLLRILDNIKEENL
jgi:hypothetical protein